MKADLGGVACKECPHCFNDHQSRPPYRCAVPECSCGRYEPPEWLEEVRAAESESTARGDKLKRIEAYLMDERSPYGQPRDDPYAKGYTDGYAQAVADAREALGEIVGDG